MHLPALDQRLDKASRAPLAVALSGGGDSLALLVLTLAWAKGCGRPVLAVTVDHGLNPLSAVWTAAAGDMARRLGADWRGLVWEGPKPTTGVQAKARAARHALLATAARAAGAKVLLMGHTANDVAEGERMRQADVRGLGRLREWAPSPAWPEGRGVFLLRPMLAVRRDALRALLTERGLTWLDDPANADMRYARVRARTHLSAHPRTNEEPGLDCDASDSPGAPASAEMSGGGAASIAKNVRWQDGEASLPLEAMAGAEARAVLSTLLLCVAGATQPPRGRELERLLGTIRAGGVATLSGCRIDARGDMLTIRRAPPRRGQPARPNEPSAWVAARFAAACGLYPNEAAIPPAPGCDDGRPAL